MLKSFLSLFLQSSCPCCQRTAKTIVCLDCYRKLQSCRLDNPSYRWRGSLPVFVWGRYSGLLRQAIAQLKYYNQPQLGRVFGQWLAQAWLNSGNAKPPSLAVLPIPIHQDKLKTRGFNQTELIGRSFCQLTGYSLHQGLVRVKQTKAMFGLDVQSRKQNMRDSLAIAQNWQHQPPRSPVLILDDIYTTGATVKEAARVLRQQGIKVFGVVVMATPMMR